LKAKPIPLRIFASYFANFVVQYCFTAKAAKDSQRAAKKKESEPVSPVGETKADSLYNASMRILNFTVVMTPDVTGGYVVTCPALPGLVTEGDTLDEARAMATDAIQGYLESLRKDGEPIPTDESITEQLAVEVA
jgi:predicted RNase H-like HicB family nuclease